MGTIIELLAFLGGAVAVIAIGTRISLYFHTCDTPGVHPLIAPQVRETSSDQAILERYTRLYSGDTISQSSRYAWISLIVIACIVVFVILVVVGTIVL